MSRRIAIIDGHPDPDRARFVHALADSYADGAIAGGHAVRRIEVAQLDFPMLKSRRQWTDEPLPPALAEAQAAIGWADHIVILYPLWLGDVPAMLKAFFEQVMRPGFALTEGVRPTPMLKGKSARIVVTMGMPGFFYAFYYRAHSLKSLERNVLKLVGIRPVRHVIIGAVELDEATRKGWLDDLNATAMLGE